MEKENETWSDSPQEFGRFYSLIYERPLPQHAMRDWIVPLYKARDEGKGLVVTAFRGSTKTTTLSIAFAAFRIGLEPSKSCLLVQAGDRLASDTAAQIADLIAHSRGWKLAFAHIEPDRQVAWGADGYEVKDTRPEYDDWRSRCARDKGKDPTFVGLGYKSRAIIGKHPTGLLLVDDIHDETNTRSGREMETVVKILTSTILPTVTPKTWQVVVGTPWQENDALAHLISSGRFVHKATPVIKNRKSTWPDKVPQGRDQKTARPGGRSRIRAHVPAGPQGGERNPFEGRMAAQLSPRKDPAAMAGGDGR